MHVKETESADVRSESQARKNTTHRVDILCVGTRNRGCTEGAGGKRGCWLQAWVLAASVGAGKCRCWLQAWVLDATSCVRFEKIC